MRVMYLHGLDEEQIMSDAGETQMAMVQQLLYRAMRTSQNRSWCLFAVLEIHQVEFGVYCLFAPAPFSSYCQIVEVIHSNSHCSGRYRTRMSPANRSFKA